MLCIRRAIIDAFGSQETSTVLGDFRRLRQDYFDPRGVLIIKITVPIIETNKVRDRFGMACVLQTSDALSRKVKWQGL